MLKKILFFFFAASVIWASSPTVIEAPELLSYAQNHLPHEGTLRLTEDGFLYVALTKKYILELSPLLGKEKQVVCPPPYFAKGKVGAHITVAMPNEMKAWKKEVPFIGKKVSFSILRLEKVDLQNSILQAKTVYMLSIESPQIAEIRKKLGLPLKVQGYDFHITIAVDCP